METGVNDCDRTVRNHTGFMCRKPALTPKQKKPELHWAKREATGEYGGLNEMGC